jgi:hypothetical protein
MRTAIRIPTASSANTASHADGLAGPPAASSATPASHAPSAERPNPTVEWSATAMGRRSAGVGARRECARIGRNREAVQENERKQGQWRCRYIESDDQCHPCRRDHDNRDGSVPAVTQRSLQIQAPPSHSVTRGNSARAPLNRERTSFDRERCRTNRLGWSDTLAKGRDAVRFSHRRKRANHLSRGNVDH